MESLNSNSQERELYQLQQMQHKAKESCMKSFRLLQSHLQVLSYNDLKINGCLERAFATLFEQDVQTFTGIMLLNLDQLEKQLDKDEFQGDRSMASFCVINKQFQMFINTQFTWDYDSQMTKKYFAEYTRIEYDRRMNERQMQSRESKVVSSKALDASLVVTECSGTKSDKHDTSSSSRTYITHAVDVDIRPVNDQVPFAEVRLTTQHNVPVNEQQYTEQSEPIYDTYLLEKVDSNNTPDLTNMCHRGGEIDQDAEQYQAKSPLLKAELVKSKEMIEKETYNELSRRFLLLEKHCISLEISIQHKEESFQSNKPCKNQDAPEFCEFFEINDLKAQLQAKTTLICNLKNQIKSVKEASNEAKVKHEIDVLETINIELESSVAKLLAENEKLNKENEHLKQTYKELYDSIKKTRIQTKDHNDSLIAQVNSKTVENADLKAQIQEKVFANVALKNELRKLKGNSAANEQLHKENEHLKQTYQELYDSIKKTSVQNKDNSDSLISQINQKSVENADLKAQIQEKVFANAALKNELRKLKGNSVDTKFAKPSILGKPVLQPLRNQSVVRQPNAFKSERPNFPKPRNSQKVSYGSNDMAHNHYLEEARKKAQERNRNSKPSVMHTTSLQNTTNGSKPNPRSNNQISRSLPVSKSSCGMSNGVSLVDHSRNSSSFSDSKHFFCSTCHKCVFNANHDACITKFLKEVNSRAKVQSPKTKNINKSVEPKSHTQKPGRQIATGQSPGLGHQLMTPGTISPGLVPQPPSPTPNVPPTKNDWDSVFFHMFDEYFNPSPSVVQHCSGSGESSFQKLLSNQRGYSVNQPQKHIEKWTKDHPLDKIIGDPSRPISTRLQLQTEALFCYYDALLSSIEHKSYKDALTESCWFDAMKSSMSSIIWRLGASTSSRSSDDYYLEVDL
ncbi:hypothetical protein Tco_1313669 [Tanacetum coccineum]